MLLVVAHRPAGAHVAVGLALAACHCSSPATSPTNDAGGSGDGGTASSVQTTASVPLDGDPNGLFWDAPTSTLYIADDENNRIVTFRDGTGTEKYADLPAAPANGPGLGQLVKLADGSIIVTRFGGGTTGDVVQVKPDRSSAIIAGLDPEKRRIGLTVAPDGAIYEGYFVRKNAAQVGAVAKLTLDGTETDVVTGLTKVVGVLATGDTLFVSDQVQGKLFKAPLSSLSSLSGVADLPNADLLCEGPNGSIFSGGSDGSVRSIDASGRVTVFEEGFAAVRGVAYDPGTKRIFIANHAGAPGTNTIEIRPVP